MILDREQRASDLATKADRDISPKLTDEQYHALLHYTFKAGFKHPVQLLEAFVGDLSGWHRKMRRNLQANGFRGPIAEWAVVIHSFTTSTTTRQI